uniref:Uncharacterized protein n=1 Tax=Anopheles quadriannulatus TaxID=34691 RepID=A0A182WR83_ANOQN
MSTTILNQEAVVAPNHPLRISVIHRNV